MYRIRKEIESDGDYFREVIENKKIDVVVTPTKRSNTLILDRLTGEPIFDFRFRKAPRSKLPGEKTSFYQPDLEFPEPFGRNEFSKKDLWSYDEEIEKETNIKYENFQKPLLFSLHWIFVF